MTHNINLKIILILYVLNKLYTSKLVHIVCKRSDLNLPRNGSNPSATQQFYWKILIDWFHYQTNSIQTKVSLAFEMSITNMLCFYCQ